MLDPNPPPTALGGPLARLNEALTSLLQALAGRCLHDCEVRLACFMDASVTRMQQIVRLKAMPLIRQSGWKRHSPASCKRLQAAACMTVRCNPLALSAHASMHQLVKLPQVSKPGSTRR